MDILFIHQNFPCQFRAMAPELVRLGHNVAAIRPLNSEETAWQGVQLYPYTLDRGSSPGIHPWVGDLESATIRGEACFRKALELRERHFEPDLIIAHPGWGESLFMKEVWPKAKLGIYCEFYYQPYGADTGFDPEFPAKYPDDLCRLRLKNLTHKLHFEVADAGISPTCWQASTFPQPFREKITVVHDGIDTETLAPFPDASLTLALRGGGTLVLTRRDEVVTFVNRNLEPTRGYHVFMRALPEILRRRPKARVLIVGGDDVSYGARPENGKAWKDIFIDEVRPQIPDDDWARVHFVGNIPHVHFPPLLQISTVHVYFTYPFVLSWSLMEAMSCGCAIVASDTQPLREVIRHDETGRLVGFFDVPALSEAVCELLDDAPARARLGSAARQFVVENYDLRTVCLPRQMAWVDSL